MGMFLNNIVPAERYKDMARTRFFVNKTLMIADFIAAFFRMRQTVYPCLANK